MTPKEKAEDLFYKFLDSHISTVPMSKDEAKHMAMICADEIINGNFGEGYDHKFWLQVKREIENL